MSAPIGRIDNVVHQRVRLGILTVLSEAELADFAFLRDTLELTDGNLSSNLQVLEQAGYVEIEKTYEGRRPRTRVRATRVGRQALREEIAVLEAIVARVNGAAAPAE
ncbi:MAG: winged helix-turn-helix domain-containing protein [Solirubrobacteraceae bacterium]